MNSRQKLFLAMAFGVSLLAIGVPYWQSPYARLALPDAIINLALVVPFAGAAAVRALGGVAFSRAVVIVGLAAPCAIALRVVVGVFADRTSHNLWPFELILASLVGFAVSLAGALVGSALVFVLRRHSGP